MHQHQQQQQQQQQQQHQQKPVFNNPPDVLVNAGPHPADKMSMNETHNMTTMTTNSGGKGRKSSTSLTNFTSLTSSKTQKINLTLNTKLVVMKCLNGFVFFQISSYASCLCIARWVLY
jgi:hypothetical protein